MTNILSAAPVFTVRSLALIQRVDRKRLAVLFDSDVDRRESSARRLHQQIEVADCPMNFPGWRISIRRTRLPTGPDPGRTEGQHRENDERQ
jgi:hypothetical protein